MCRNRRDHADDQDQRDQHRDLDVLEGSANRPRAVLARVLENKELSDLVTALGCGLGKNFDIARLRYGKIIILADADSDGHHIATLLLTFIYRHMPQLMTSVTSFSRSRRSTASTWGRTHSGRWTTRTRPNPEGGMATAAPPGDYALQRPRRDDAACPVGHDTEPADAPPAARPDRSTRSTDRIINELMGKDPSARFRFIMDEPRTRSNSTSSARPLPDDSGSAIRDPGSGIGDRGLGMIRDPGLVMWDEGFEMRDQG